MGTPQEEIPVVIVGGGLAGLTTACLLTSYHVRCVVLEKHVKISPHPRAVGFTTRTMEIFSKLDITDKIPQMPADFRLRRIQVESLAGQWGDELGKPGGHGQSQMATYSPYAGAAIAQDKLEPMLRAKAEELGCDVRFGHRVLRFDPSKMNNDPVTLTVSHPSGTEYTILARYLVAADGHRSLVREELRISTSGIGYLQTIDSVLIRAPSLDKYLEKGFHQFQIRQQDGFAGFLTTYNDSRWVLMFTDKKERSEEEVQKSILSATGIPDLQYEILATGLWELRGRIAETFAFPSGTDAQPKIFLTGDAAHTLPPTRGGYGANTGIGDAHNLAWKLASVIHGKSEPALLKSYDAERRAVAWVRHNQTFAGPDYKPFTKEGDDFGPVRDPIAVELGQVYDSDVIVSDEKEKTTDTSPITLKPDELNGRPGSRAPYVPLVKADGSSISTLDLFGEGWVLVSQESKWRDVTQTVAQQSSLPVTVAIIPSDDMKEEKESAFVESFGLQAGRASLVRPDGHVAWRSRPWSDEQSAVAELRAALKQVACLVS